MKTSELIGPALDWATCKAADFFKAHRTTPKQFLHIWKTHPLSDPWFHPSTDWSQGGPIIEREGLGVSQHGNILDRPEGRWQCVGYAGGVLLGNHRPICAYGPTPLIAAMRCYVASKLGDEVEIPEELKCNSSTHQP